MTTEKSKREAPISVRASKEERDVLEDLAGRFGMSLSGYLKWCGLNPNIQPPPRPRHRQPIKNQAALVRLLAWMGTTRLPQNFNQMMKAVHTGALPVTPDTEAAIMKACHQIDRFYRLVREVLGFSADDAP